MSSCAASCCMCFPAASCASAISACSLTATAARLLRAADPCSARQSRANRRLCHNSDAPPALQPCRSSSASPVPDSIFGSPSSPFQQRGPMQIPPESSLASAPLHATHPPLRGIADVCANDASPCVETATTIAATSSTLSVNPSRLDNQLPLRRPRPHSKGSGAIEIP